MECFVFQSQNFRKQGARQLLHSKWILFIKVWILHLQQESKSEPPPPKKKRKKKKRGHKSKCLQELWVQLQSTEIFESNLGNVLKLQIKNNLWLWQYFKAKNTSCPSTRFSLLTFDADTKILMVNFLNCRVTFSDEEFFNNSDQPWVYPL